MSYRSARGSIKAALIAALLVGVGLLSAASAQASAPPTLSLAITNSSITVGGTLQSGAVNVVATATGVKETSAVLFLLKPGASFEEAENAENHGKHDPNSTGKYGSIVYNAEVAPGRSSEGQIYLQPGQYVALVPGEGTALSHEAFVQETITAKPGWYVQACFMETQDGRNHTRLGMERIIKIVK